MPAAPSKKEVGGFIRISQWRVASDVSSVGQTGGVGGIVGVSQGRVWAVLSASAGGWGLRLAWQHRPRGGRARRYPRQPGGGARGVIRATQSGGTGDFSSIGQEMRRWYNMGQPGEE